MTLSDFLSRSSKRRILKNCTVFSDYRRFTDNNACSMVNKQSFADCSARMNIYSRYTPCTVRNHTCNNRMTVLKKPICTPMPAYCPKTGIAKNNFPFWTRCRIAIQHCLNIRFPMLCQIIPPLLNKKTTISQRDGHFRGSTLFKYSKEYFSQIL